MHGGARTLSYIMREDKEKNNNSRHNAVCMESDKYIGIRTHLLTKRFNRKPGLDARVLNGKHGSDG